MRVRTLTRTFLLAAVAVLGITTVACTPKPSAPANKVPLAIFTTSPANTGNAPFDVDFDASDSSDPDGTIVSYEWDFGGAGTASGVTTSNEFPAGTFVVKLTVTDNKGAKGTSSTTITSQGPPPAPTGLTKTGSGTQYVFPNIETYGDFAWDEVPGATKYQITLKHDVGCQTTHSGEIAGPASSGRVQAFGLCLGSQYNVAIRAFANGQWGPWSPDVYIQL